MNSASLRLIESLKNNNNYKENVYDIEEFRIKNEKYANSMFLISKGHIAIHKINDKGEKFFLKLLVEDQTYGGHLCLGNKEDFAYVKVLTEKTIIYEFSMVVIRKMIVSDYKYQKDLFFLWNEQYLYVERRIRLLKIKSIPLRLVAFLHYLNIQMGEDYAIKGDRILGKIISQEEISDYIRANRISVNYAISYLKKRFMIDFFGKKIILKKGFFEYCRSTILTN